MSVSVTTPPDVIPLIIPVAMIIVMIPVIIRAIAKVKPDYTFTTGSVKAMRFIATDIGAIVTAVIGAVYLPGWICSNVGIECTGIIALEIAVIWSLIVGVCNFKSMKEAIARLKD